ncbi:DUF2330 domain-containing protein [Frigidibacter sp. SD6-1]|uniref:DUF2330 domain-containing protein n=1 Tax=Frigidibacter sp. SD6-1 TaxID=3032581 RepID=UPI0024DF7BE4|nr:DUF2330 domain-containing protein [Frigidibacter sp. SD6-1]
MRRRQLVSVFIALAVMITALPQRAAAFCGFYVSRADGSLYNQGSRVIYTRFNRTSVITMASDYKGPASDFAMVVPTPFVLQKNQVKIVDARTVDHLDGYTAPRLVEYFDYDPCEVGFAEPVMAEAAVESGSNAKPTRRDGARALGVKILSEYAVGDYDILMLSARESNGLLTWLTSEGYKLPTGAEKTVQAYLDMGMKFFVARVNLSRHAANERQELQPLQITFRSDDFMLPIQLGKLNGDGPQDLIVMTLTKDARVALTNYMTRELPTDVNVPVFVKDMFPDFYRTMFARAAGPNGAFLEYAWDMGWCDPCADDPLTFDEFRELGASWITRKNADIPPAFVTRIHIRYDSTSFFEDLKFRETENRENFQGRYVLNHPFDGEITCEAGKDYVKEVRARLKEEAKTLRDLTGWSEKAIRREMRKTVPVLYQ